MHQFYDFVRISFRNLRNRWLFKLFESGLSDLKRDKKYTDQKTCYFHNLFT